MTIKPTAPVLENRFAETLLILRIDGGGFVVDLRRPLPPEHQEALAAVGPGKMFAVITSANPMGKSQSNAANAVAQQALADAISRISTITVPVDGVSPDMSHREPGFAVWVPEAVARALAQAFGQLAYFWFDGERFWLVYADGETRMPLPPGRV